MKWLALAIAKYVRRYKSLCSVLCRDYSGLVREFCVQICIRYVHRCNPRLEGYTQCVETALENARNYIENKVKPRFETT